MGVSILIILWNAHTIMQVILLNNLLLLVSNKEGLQDRLNDCKHIVTIVFVSVHKANMVFGSENISCRIYSLIYNIRNKEVEIADITEYPVIFIKK